MSLLRPRAWLLLLLAQACATTPSAPPSSRMVPSGLAANTATRISIYVDEIKLASAAQKRETPFEAMSGKFPLTEDEGMAQFHEAIRTTLVSNGAKVETQREGAAFVLVPTILGGMTIPFPESYSILFVRYELFGRDGGRIAWSQNVYSQSKFEREALGESTGKAEAAYGRLAAANLRQMAASLAAWHAGKDK